MTEQEIKQAASLYADDHKGISDYHVARNAFIAGAEAAAPKWIPVEMELPASSIDVQVCNAGMVRNGFYYSGNWYAGRIDNPIRSVTHWMPLSSPPNTQS